MKYQLNYSDDNYASAINYDGFVKSELKSLRVTIDIEGKLFVLPCGSSDHITVTQKSYSNGTVFYILGENNSLDYISLTSINLFDNIVRDCYLSGDDINNSEYYSYDVLNKDTEEQIKILSEYL